MIVTMDRVSQEIPRDRVPLDINWNKYRPRWFWKRVRISGYELWKVDLNRLIAQSKGYFDSAGYERRLRG